MLDKIGYSLAARVNICIFGLLVIFHLAAITGVVLLDYVPLDFLWGGILQTREQFLRFEMLSLGVQIVCLFLTLVRADYLKLPRLHAIAHLGMWVIVVIFAVNTVGNLLAKTTFEKTFALITATLALFSLRLAVGSAKDPTT